MNIKNSLPIELPVTMIVDDGPLPALLISIIHAILQFGNTSNHA